MLYVGGVKSLPYNKERGGAVHKLFGTAAAGLCSYLFYLIFDKSQIEKADKIVSIVECVAFAVTFFVHVYGLITLIAAENQKVGLKVLFPLARRFVIIGMLLHFCFGLLTMSWLISVQQTGSFNYTLDMLYGFLELFLCCYSWFGVQFVMNATVRKSVFPGVSDPACTLLGEHLIKLGVDPNLLAKAVEAQQAELESRVKTI